MLAAYDELLTLRKDCVIDFDTLILHLLLINIETVRGCCRRHTDCSSITVIHVLSGSFL